MKRLHVLYVVSTLPVGGAEQHLFTVLKKLDKERFRPFVCCLGEKGTIGSELQRQGFEVTSLGRMRHKRWDLRIVTDLRRFIERNEIDIVHTHLYHANMYGRVAARLAGTKGIVTTVHNVYTQRKLKRRLINRILATVTDKVIAVSGAVRDDLLKYDWIPPSKLDVIYNGIDLSRFETAADREPVRRDLKIPPDAFVIGNVARLEPQKGHADLLRAFKLLSGKHPSLYLLIVGDGSLMDELKRRAFDLALSDRVVFAGMRLDIPLLLNGMDLFVSSSLWEGLPLALLEAMAAGVPVVATNVGGVREVIMDGVSGLLTPPSDVSSLVKAIESVLGDREYLHRIRQGGRERVRAAFSVERMMGSLEELYTEIASRKIAG